MHHDADSSCGVTYCYRADRLRLLLFCAPSPLLFVILFYAIINPKPMGMDLMPYFVVGIVPTIMFIASYLYLRSFSISDYGDYFILTRLGRSKTTYYKDISVVIYKEGFGRSGDSLSVYGKNKVRILSVNSSFDDIQSLAGLMRSHATKYGAIYKRKDRYGSAG